MRVSEEERSVRVNQSLILIYSAERVNLSVSPNILTFRRTAPKTNTLFTKQTASRLPGSVSMCSVVPELNTDFWSAMN